MAWWQNHPNTYSYKGFIDIPEGDHRVRISNVEVERFSKGKKCIEVSFEVSGYHGMLWHHLWYDPNNLDDYERAFVPFFNSFGLDNNISRCKKWIGATGAIRVKHERRGYEFEAKYIRCLYGEQRDRLPPWEEPLANIDLSHLTEIPF